MDKTQEERNQLMLEAIQRKHQTKCDDEIQIYSPTVFTIPTLKIASQSRNTGAPCNNFDVPTCGVNGLTKTDNQKASPINQLVLQQLHKNKINGLSNGFMVPQLKAAGGPLPAASQFDIPLLKRLENSNKNENVNENDKTMPEHKLENDLKCLSIQDTDGVQCTMKTALESLLTVEELTLPKPVVAELIDLTKALIVTSDNSTNVRKTASKASHARTTLNALDDEFNIPYIDCDRYKESKNLTDNFCTLSVANVKYNYKVALPSPIAWIYNREDKLRGRKLFPRAATDIEVLHLKQYRLSGYGSHIKRFSFDTKSPDDIVKESLNKYQRFSYT